MNIFNKLRLGATKLGSRTRVLQTYLIPEPIRPILKQLIGEAKVSGVSGEANCNRLQEAWRGYCNAFFKPQIDATTKRAEAARKKFADMPDDTVEEALESKYWNKEEKVQWTKRRASEITKGKGITAIKLSTYLAVQNLKKIEKWREAYEQECKDNLPATRTGMDNGIVYATIVFILFIMEIPFTFSIMQSVLPIPTWMIYMVCMLVSALYGISAHFFTKGICWRKYSKAYLALSVGLLTLMAQALLRTMEHSTPQIIMVLLNASLYLSNITVSWWHNRYRQHWAAAKAERAATKKINGGIVKLNNYQLGMEMIGVKYHSTINMAVSKKVARDMAEIDTNRRNVQAEYGGLNEHLIFLQELEESSVLTGNAKIEVAFWEAKSKNRTGFNVRNAAAILLLFISMFLGSCKNNTFNEAVNGVMYDSTFTKEITLVWDKSQSNKNINYDDGATISSYIIDKELHLNDNAFIYNGATIHLSTTTGTGLPYIETISLPQGEHNKLMQNLVVRERTVDSFEKVLRSAICKYADSPNTATSTNLHRSSCYQLQQLAMSKATEKVYYRWSDQVEESTLINFIPYLKKNMLNNSYNEIAGIMNRSCDMGRLDSIRIYLIANPQDAITSDIIMATNEYWANFYRSHQAEVIVKTSLY